MKSLAETQIEHIERLIERQKSMTRLGLGDDFMTLSVAEIRGAMAEAEQEWMLMSLGIKYLDPMVQPPQEELLESHQHWVWLAGATPPHWEIRGTGVVVDG
jgi:hypothetical protein